MNKNNKIILSLLFFLTIGVVVCNYTNQLTALFAEAVAPNPGHSLVEIEGSADLATKTYVNDALSGVSGSNWTVSGSNIYRSDGNVGIGTASPSAKLHVDGNIIANSPTSASHVATKGYVDSQGGGLSTCQSVSGSGTVQCPDGWTLTGGGGSCSTTIGSSLTYGGYHTEIIPLENGFQARCQAWNSSYGWAGWRNGTAYAICCQ